MILHLFKRTSCVLATLFLVCSFNFVNAQFVEISSTELESFRIENMKNGNPGDLGLYQEMHIETEDFDLCSNNIEAIKTVLAEQFAVEMIYISDATKEIVVIFDFHKIKTDDFLKIIKESMSPSGVYLKNYSEIFVKKI